MYNNGQGVLKDDREAVKWYRKAAEQGYADAQNNLGLMYYSGQGVLQNHIKAYMWANLARYNGSTNAQKLLDIITKEMIKQNISRAQSMSSRCLESDYRNCG